VRPAIAEASSTSWTTWRLRIARAFPALATGGNVVAIPRLIGRYRRGLRRVPCYNAAMAMFHVVVRRSGPEYDHARPLDEQSGWEAHAAFMDALVGAGFIVLGGPLVDGRVAHAVEAESEDAVRATLARDPWSNTHLVVDTVEPWTIRLDGR
jgi:uncharacterized protein YciI